MLIGQGRCLHQLAIVLERRRPYSHKWNSISSALQHSSPSIVYSKRVKKSVKNSRLVHVKREGEDITRDDLLYEAKYS
jgi:hypothetical protein